MASPYNPPVKGEDFVTFISLEDYANPGNFKSSPTLAVGDFKVSTDGGALANIATTASVSPASSIFVKINLSTSEMNGDVIMLQGIDQTSPKEWSDFALTIITTSS